MLRHSSWSGVLIRSAPDPSQAQDDVNITKRLAEKCGLRHGAKLENVAEECLARSEISPQKKFLT